MIPKVIHYCWLSGDPIPEKLQRCMDSWKKFLPDYEFVLWDLERFDIKTSQWVKEAFEARKYAFAADYIRLYAVYNYGGVYMDMDVEVVRPFDDLLASPYILGLESEKGVEAGVFGAERYSLFLKKILSYYERRSFLKEDGTFDMRPLPSVLFEILTDNYVLRERNSVGIPLDSSMMYLFPSDYLTAKSYLNGKIEVMKHTYTIHHFAGSWLTRGRRVRVAFLRLLGESNANLLVRIKMSIFKKLRIIR